MTDNSARLFLPHLKLEKEDNKPFMLTQLNNKPFMATELHHHHLIQMSKDETTEAHRIH